MAYKRGSHYGSFAKGFIQAFLQAQRLQMMREYYESRIEDARIADLGLGYDRRTGKYWNPTSGKFDGDQYQGPPDWKGMHDKEVYAGGYAHGGTGGGNVYNTGNFWTPEVMKHTADRLVNEAGLSQQGASGLVARWAAIEAGGGPSDVSADGKAVGINQARGDRQPEGYRSWSLDQQLDYIINTDLKAPKQAKALEVLRSAKTSEDGARGASMYERAEGYDEKTGNDNFTARTPVDKVFTTVYGGGKAPATTATTTPATDTGTGSGKVTTGGAPVDAKGRPIKIDPNTGRAIDPDTGKPVANAPAKSVQADTQRPYETAGLEWAGPPSYDQAARLRAHEVQRADITPQEDPRASDPLAVPDETGTAVVRAPPIPPDYGVRTPPITTGPMGPAPTGRAAPTPPITTGPMGPPPLYTGRDLPTPPITTGPAGPAPSTARAGYPTGVPAGLPPPGYTGPGPTPLTSPQQGPPIPPRGNDQGTPSLGGGFGGVSVARPPMLGNDQGTPSLGGGFGSPVVATAPAVSTGRTGPAEINVPLAGGETDERRQPASVARQAIPPRPGLTYYAPTTGNARQPQPMQYQDPNDPRIYRGPGAVVPAAPPAPVARAPTPTLAVTAPQSPSTPASTADITPRPLPDTAPLPPVRPTVTLANDTGPSTGPSTQTAYAIPPTPGRDYDDDFALRAMDRDIDQGFLDMTQASRKGGQVRRPFIALELGGNPGSAAGDTGGGASSNWGGAGRGYSYSGAGFTPKSSTPLDPSKAIVYGQTAGAGSVSPGQWLANQPTSTMYTPAQWGAGNYTAQNMMDAFNALPSDQQKYYNNALGLWRGITQTPGGGAGKQALQYDLSNLTPSAATPTPATPAPATPAPATPAPAQPVVTVTNAQTAQTQPGAYNPPNTTVKGNAFTGNPVNYGQGTNYFGPNYNAGSFNQDTLPGAATPTTNLLDDGGGVSAAPLGMLPGMGGGQQQIPPVYFNPQIYAQAGAPINRGVSANTIPSFAAMAVPTYAARKGGGIPSPRSLSRVMRYAGGGDVDLSDPEGDEMEQQMMYDDRMSPAAVSPASASAQGVSSQTQQIGMPNEEVYVPDTVPTAQAQPVSYMHPSAGGNFVIPGGMGGMGGPRMSMGAGPRVSAPRAAKGSTDIFPEGAQHEDYGPDTTPAPAADDIPTKSAQANEPPINDQGDLSQGFRGLLGGALKLISDLTQPGAKVPPNSQVAQNRSDLVTGKGGEDPKAVEELNQHIGQHLDPSQSLDIAQRNINGMWEVAKSHLLNGDVEGARRFMASMLIYSQGMSAKYGEEAVRRYWNGDVQGALDNLHYAYQHIPDANQISGVANANGGADVRLTNAKGVLKWQGEVAPQEILAAATGTANKSLFWHMIENAAAQTGDEGARASLKREGEEESAARVSAAEQGWDTDEEGSQPRAIPVQGERPPTPVVDTTPESTAPKPTPAVVQQYNRIPIGETPTPNVGPTTTSTLPSPQLQDISLQRIDQQEAQAEQDDTQKIYARYDIGPRPTPPSTRGLTAIEARQDRADWKVQKLDPWTAKENWAKGEIAADLRQAAQIRSQKFSAMKLAVTEKFSQGQQTEREKSSQRAAATLEANKEQAAATLAENQQKNEIFKTNLNEYYARTRPRASDEMDRLYHPTDANQAPDTLLAKSLGATVDSNGAVDQSSLMKLFGNNNDEWARARHILYNTIQVTNGASPADIAEVIAGVISRKYSIPEARQEIDTPIGKQPIVYVYKDKNVIMGLPMPDIEYNNLVALRGANKGRAAEAASKEEEAKALEEERQRLLDQGVTTQQNLPVTRPTGGAGGLGGTTVPTQQTPRMAPSPRRAIPVPAYSP